MRAFAGLVNTKHQYTMFCDSKLKCNPPTIIPLETIMRKFCDGDAGWYFFEGKNISNFDSQWILVLKSVVIE